MAPQFEDACPLPFPSGDRQREGSSIAAADFVAWQARRRVDAAPEPAHEDVYRVWLNRPETTDRRGRAVYFQAGGEDYPCSPP